MNRTTKQLASIGFAFLLIASAFSVVQIGSAQSAPDQYSITQNGQCTTVTPIQGEENVADHYDYRNPEKTPNETGANYYASFGTQDMQENQVSQMYLYEYNGDVSLVFLHDMLDTDEQDGDFGSTISMDIAGLPSGSWAVEDDDYQGEDDTWDKGATTTQVDWVWAAHRTDGGAYTGLQNLGTTGAITIESRFNENADRWDSVWGGGNNVINDWKFVDGDSSKQSLTMGEQLTITAGPCEPDETTTTEDPTETQTQTETETQTATETQTETATQTETQTQTATETQTETQTETTTETTTTEQPPETTTEQPTTTPTDEPPTAKLTAEVHDEDVNQFVLDASGSTDDNGIVKYVWDFGDGSEKVVTTPDDEPFERKFPKYHASGNYTATVTAYDESGQSDSANVTITVNDKYAPTLDVEELDVPSEVAAGDEFTSKLHATYDPTGVTVDWTFEGEAPSGGQGQEAQDWNGNEQRSWAKHTFENASEDKKKVVVTVTDGEGNSQSKALWIKVHPADWTPPADGDDGDDSDDDDGSNDGHGHADSNDDDDDSWVDVHRKAYERKQAREEAQKKAEEQKKEKERNETTPTPTPEPTFDEAMVEIVDFQLSDESIEAGQKITATAKVMNGNEVNGTTTVRLVSDGTEVATKDVSLDAGETKTVTMSHTFDSAGTYTLKAGGLSKSFTVTAPTTDDKALQDETPTMQQETTNDSGQPGFGVVAALIALVAAALIAVRRD